MKILFIYPSMGEKEKYRLKKTGGRTRTWCLEPLSIAALNGLTSKSWDRAFYDDRIEEINYDEKCDVVALSVETYTAKRAYEIADKFRERGVKVVMGGFHPSLCTSEAKKHCDSVIIGEAEEIWEQVLHGIEKNKLKSEYSSNKRADLSKIRVNRSIFNGKFYFPFTLVETGRGCNFSCEFCSVSSFFKAKFVRRPINDIIDEINKSGSKRIVFVDDNICADFGSAKALFKALIPLKIKWISQAGVNIAKDEELLDLMKKSGCIGLLIGFESLNKQNLCLIGKYHNLNVDYDKELIKRLYDRNIKIYASFVVGYDYDDKELIEKTVDYAVRNKFIISNFYQLTPFPGTRLYQRLKKEKRLLYDKWWLDNRYSYGDVVYKPIKMSEKELSDYCRQARNKFYSYKSILKRSISSVNCGNFSSFLFFFIVNVLTKKEVYAKQGRKLGRVR